MNPICSEVISFISQRQANYKLESWGLLLPDVPVGLVFHSINKNGLVSSNIPKNLKIIHLWEDYWRLKQAIVEARINSLLNLTERVFARKTKTVKLTKPELMTFLKENHLNEPANGKFKYGLMLGNELVAAAAFSVACPVHRGNKVYKSHQLIRFCNKTGITVVGGLSKLISHFIKEQSPEDIMTYADLDWSDGSSYLKIGFKRIGELPPQKFTFTGSSYCRNYNPDSNSSSLTKQFYNQGSAKYLLDLKKPCPIN